MSFNIDALLLPSVLFSEEGRDKVEPLDDTSFYDFDDDEPIPLINESDRPEPITVLKHRYLSDTCMRPEWSFVVTDPSSFSPCGRFGHTAVVCGRQMYVFGGKDAERYFNDVNCFHLDSKTWTSHSPVSLQQKWPSPRSGHAAVATAEYMYVLSGEVKANVCAQDLWKFHFESKTWTLVTSAIPFAPRKGHSLHYLPQCCTADRSDHSMLVVFGGAIAPRNVPTSDVYLFNLAQGIWTKLRMQGPLPPPRSYHVSQIIDASCQMIVFGGRTAPSSPVNHANNGNHNATNQYLNDLHILDIATGRWRTVECTGGVLPSHRTCCTSVIANGVFGVFCGGNNSMCFLEGYEFCLATEQWSRVCLKNQPACSRPTIVYCDGELLLFGGYVSGGCLGDLLSLKLPPLTLRDSCVLMLQKLEWESKNGSHQSSPRSAMPQLL